MDKVTIAEARQFIADAEKKQQDFWRLADASWREIKKQGTNNKFLPVSKKGKGAKYPAWHSIFKIRQPLVLSRVGIPIGKDTTQDGSDNIGATAALCLERLAIGLSKTYDFFDVMSACRDDFLAVNFALPRAYYERKEVKERVKEYITPQGEGDNAFFVDSSGKPIDEQKIQQDDDGYFVYVNQTVDVTEEKICLEHIHYKHVFIDPDIKRWNRCRRLAFKHFYSKPEFIEIFGKEAYLAIRKPADQDKPSDAKNPLIGVYEYWDDYAKEVFWFAESGDDFIKPQSYRSPEELEDEAELEAENGLYDLEGLFPVPKQPLLVNAAPDEFWPIPEYHQMCEVFEDIHTLFGRMMALAKSARARLLYDGNIEGLDAAISEANENDAISVPNLAQALAGNGGSLDNAAQYLNVKPIMEALDLCARQLDQRLMTVYRLTGTSDLLQGQTDQVQRTYGEQQQKEKYALNLLAPMQQKMQELVRDCHQLVTEIALKNFKDSSLDMYIMPQTLPPDHQQRYRAALGMLKENTKRFRIELETDSTINLNEEYDKQLRVELVNTMTAALKDTAAVAESSPALITPILHSLKFLIQGFRQGKMFQGEVTEAIQKAIEQSEQAAEAAKDAPPPFDKDQAMFSLEQQRLAFEQSKQSNQDQIEVMKINTDSQLEQLKLNSQAQLEAAKIQNEQTLASLKSQFDSFKAQMEMSQSQAELQLEYEKVNASIMKASQELEIKQQALIIEYQKAGGEQQIAEFKASLDKERLDFDAQLAAQQESLEQYKTQLDMKEKYMTEARLQSEHELEQMRTKVETMSMIKEMSKPPEIPPITVNMAAPAKKKTKKKATVKRDENGDIIGIETEED